MGKWWGARARFSSESWSGWFCFLPVFAVVAHAIEPQLQLQCTILLKSNVKSLRSRLNALPDVTPDVALVAIPSSDFKQSAFNTHAGAIERAGG